MDPHLMMLVLALFAVVVGAVVFGGTSLAYFLDQRRPDQPARRQPGPAQARPAQPGQPAQPAPERPRAEALDPRA